MLLRTSILAAALIATGCGQAITDPEEKEPCPAGPLDLEFDAGDGSIFVDGLSVATDGACNLLVAGLAEGAINFGGAHLGAAGDPYTFVVKLDPDGGHLWSVALPDMRLDGKHVLAVDSQGAVVLGGTVFEDPTPDVPLDSAPEVTLVKLDADGNELWTRRMKGNVPTDVGYGGSFSRAVESVAAGPDGSVVIGGNFRGETDFGGVTLACEPQESDFQPTDYRPDVFLARYDADGELVFALRFGEDDYDRTVGLDVLPGGDTVVVFNGAPDAGEPSDGYGVVLMRLSPIGDIVYSKILPGSFIGGFSPSLTATEDGGFVLGGLGTLSLGAAGMVEPAFAARFDANGEPLLAGAFVGDEGVETALVSAVLPDEAGGVSAIGSFRGTLLLQGKIIAEAGSDVDGFEAHVELEHDALSGSASGEEGDDLAVALARSPGGERVVAGLRGPLLTEPGALPPWMAGARLFLRRR